MTEDKIDFWAVVELFGHQRIVGRVSEASIGGCSFVRVDVPEANGQPAFTKFYGNGAIYAMTPVAEDIGRAMVETLRARPIDVYSLPAPLRERMESASRSSGEQGADGDEDWDDDDEEEEEEGAL